LGKHSSAQQAARGHFVGNITEEPAYGACHPECQFPGIATLGHNCGIVATGVRKKEEAAVPASGNTDDEENCLYIKA
jgi:hypothetical protein